MAKQKRKTDWEKKHQRNIILYQRQIEELYEEAVRQAAMLGGIVGDLAADTAFSFESQPALRKQADRLLSGLYSGLYGVIVDGIKSEWTLANNKNSELARMVFGDNIGKLTKEQYSRYFSTSGAAADAFINRKVAGLNLSDRVWNYTDQFKGEIETVLDIGIHSGRSADELSQDLREFLKHPDTLFRRVRDGVDENGEPTYRLSKAAEEFHPGQGVYRSSYKNARRLAATETNIAYRTADYDRWQDMDFIVGIKICLSNNHTLNGVPFTDICDELKGDYPKDFKFTGWHPHCRCHVETIMKTQEELDADLDRMLNGEEPSEGSVNEVKDVPDNFKQWMKDNKERAETNYSMPYFIKDNEKYVPAEFREAYGSRLPYDTYAEHERAMRYNRKNAGFSEEIKKNNAELSRSLPVVQGKVMNFTEADGSKANPDYGIEGAAEKGFRDNCQTSTVAYELRRRGFDVEAKGNPVEEGFTKMREAQHTLDWRKRYLNKDGSAADYSWSRSEKVEDTVEAKTEFIKGKTSEQGRYEVYCSWKGSDESHVFIVERTKEGDLIWFDPQSGKKGSEVEKYVERMDESLVGVMRIDDKMINPRYSSRFLKARKQ